MPRELHWRFRSSRNSTLLKLSPMGRGYFSTSQGDAQRCEKRFVFMTHPEMFCSWKIKQTSTKQTQLSFLWCPQQHEHKTNDCILKIERDNNILRLCDGMSRNVSWSSHSPGALLLVCSDIGAFYDRQSTCCVPMQKRTTEVRNSEQQQATAATAWLR